MSKEEEACSLLAHTMIEKGAAAAAARRQLATTAELAQDSHKGRRSLDASYLKKIYYLNHAAS